MSVHCCIDRSNSIAILVASAQLCRHESATQTGSILLGAQTLQSGHVDAIAKAQRLGGAGEVSGHRQSCFPVDTRDHVNPTPELCSKDRGF